MMYKLTYYFTNGQTVVVNRVSQKNLDELNTTYKTNNWVVYAEDASGSNINLNNVLFYRWEKE